MYAGLKKEAYLANYRLFKENLIVLTWGNASCIDRKLKVLAIKPSGIDYEEMSPDDMVVVDLEGKVVEGKYKPSSDLPTHLYLYKNWSSIQGIVHTHSTYATIFAQARIAIQCLGTTHADVFYGRVPVTCPLKEQDIISNYERNIGKSIVECFQKNSMDPDRTPGILADRHGPFTWGKSVSKAVINAISLEEIAKMNFGTLQLSPSVREIPSSLMDKHYFRKHGSRAYYGQERL